MTESDQQIRHDFPIIALVCSTGGLASLTTVLASLPADLPAAVIALQHVSPHRRSMLSEILQRSAAMPVNRAREGDTLTPGRVLIAPEAAHLIVSADERVHLVASDGAPRPSADLLLCTLAATMGPRTVAVVLTGAGQDGATGAVAVDLLGGATLVEDPTTAYTSGMPDAVLSRHRPSAVLPVDDIGPALQDMIRRPRTPGSADESAPARSA